MCLNVFIKFLSNSFHIFTTHNYSSFWGVSNSHVPWSLRTLVSSWGTFIPNPFSHSALLSPCRISFVYLKTEVETNLSPLNVHLHGNSFIQSEQRLFYFIQATFLRHPFPLVFSLSLVILIISKFLLDNWHPYLCIIPAFSNFFLGIISVLELVLRHSSVSEKYVTFDINMGPLSQKILCKAVEMP